MMRKFIIFTAVLISGMIFGTQAYADLYTLNPTDDTKVLDWMPDVNYDPAPYLLSRRIIDPEILRLTYPATPPTGYPAI